MGAGGHFGERLALVTPGHDVAGTGDVDRGFIVPPLDRAAAVNHEELWVQHAPIQLKNQFSDFGSDGEHGAGSFRKHQAGGQGSLGRLVL